MKRILIDSREKKPEALVQALDHLGFSVEKKELHVIRCIQCKKWYQFNLEKCPQCGSIPTGEEDREDVADYAARDAAWAVERKAGDFYSSLISGRLHDQAEIGADAYGNHYFIYVEDTEESIIQEHPDQEGLIRSVTPYFQMALGIQLKFCEDADGVANAIKYTDMEAYKEYDTKYTIKKKDKLAQLMAIASIPGVSSFLGAQALSTCGSLSVAAKLTPSQVKTVIKGFGDVKAQAWYDFFNANVMVEAAMILEKMIKRKEDARKRME